MSDTIDYSHDITDHVLPSDSLNERIEVFADARDPMAGNASHRYELRVNAPGKDASIISGLLQFQHGPRDERGSLPGVTNEAVIAVVIDRLRGFQSGPYACRENALAITKLEEAMHWLQRRSIERMKQGVLGKNETHEEPR